MPQMSNRPKYSPDFSCGMILAKWLRLSACTPPWNIPTTTASPELPLALQEEGKDGDAGIGRNAHRDQGLGFIFLAQAAKDQRRRKATIWVTSSASSSPVVSSPSAVP